VNQSGIAEHAQMFGDLRLAETQTTGHVPDGTRPGKQEFHDMKTVRLGERSQRCHHGELKYASSRIYVSRNI
jgi:hypothetical protein